jgi:Ca2+-transporting ATPase
MSVSGIHMSPTSTLGTTFNDSPREYYYVKGAIDTVLARCKFYYISEDSTPGLDAATRNVILTKALSTAARGLRVIAMAYSYSSENNSKPLSYTSLPASETSSQAKDGEKSNLIFVGFQAMFDPPRSGVADSIGLLQSGGVQVIMITGDAEETALSIAKDLGLRVPRGLARSTYCLTGQAIDQMSQAELKDKVGTVSIFARTTPRHKMAIVEAFQARGAVVAMTGDGGNECFRWQTHRALIGSYFQ